MQSLSTRARVDRGAIRTVVTLSEHERGGVVWMKVEVMVEVMVVIVVVVIVVVVVVVVSRRRTKIKRIS